MYGPPISGPRVILRLLRGPALYFVAREDPKPDMPPVPDPRRAAVAGLVITLLLVLGGVLLVHVLDRTSKLQDCVMSGRTNCAPITSPDGTGG
ncbi:MAG TPA: hypothetical protein VHW25_01340 [Steroidobacteraceae bacterium]|nr:hypothetical protein [Steroidobacteraceae bacterium]